MDSLFAQGLGKDFKGYLSLGLYLAAVAIAFFQPLASCVLYAVVAGIWIVPDRRFERLVNRN